MGRGKKGQLAKSFVKRQWDKIKCCVSVQENDLYDLKSAEEALHAELTSVSELDNQMTSVHTNKQNKIFKLFSTIVNTFSKSESQVPKRPLKEAFYGQPKLFGGSVQDYVQFTEQDIPLVVKSCVNAINLYGLQHQGIFRVSGSQKVINELKNSFEKGEDPLLDLNNAPKDINSIAGVLKLYFRNLKESLFPEKLFDELIECSKLESPVEFIAQMKQLLSSLPRALYVVMRYLFRFLSHVSEYADDNMMNAYNLAVCFGPTLLPVPMDRNPVQFLNSVIEMVKNLILYQDKIFANDIEGDQYERNVLAENVDETSVNTERKFIFRSKSCPSDLNQLTNDESVRAIMAVEDEKIFASYFAKKDPVSSFDPKYVG